LERCGKEGSEFEIVVSLAQAYDDVIGGAVDLKPVASGYRQRDTPAQLECHVIVGDLITGTGIDLSSAVFVSPCSAVLA